MPVVVEPGPQLRLQRVGASVTGFVLAAVDEPHPPGLGRLLTDGLRQLEQGTGRQLGGTRPLLLDVAVPGHRLHGVGLCAATVHDVVRRADRPQAVWDAYAELVVSFAGAVAGVPRRPFLAVRDGGRERVSRLLALYRGLVGQEFPQHPAQQLVAAVVAGLRSGGEVAVTASPLESAGGLSIPVPRSA